MRRRAEAAVKDSACKNWGQSIFIPALLQLCARGGAGLNVIYMAVAVLFFNWMFRTVKRKGLLVRVGE